VCWLCDRAGATTADHIIPRTLGGSDDVETNLRPAHKLCNQLRGRQPVTPELRAYILERTAELWPARVDARDAFDGWAVL
jgi:5-methylcytosine-specific restriction endonuclease McrA